MSLLADGSGLAIYDGYSCDTHFIHSKKQESTGSELSYEHLELTIRFLVDEFELSERAAQHAIDQLVNQKVLWIDG